MSEKNKIQREILPIPDQPFTGLITYDAKDPDTSFPPIEPLRPPKGAPNVHVIARLNRQRAETPNVDRVDRLGFQEQSIRAGFRIQRRNHLRTCSAVVP